jgi:hypothetical protein
MVSLSDYRELQGVYLKATLRRGIRKVTGGVLLLDTQCKQV